MKVGQFFTFLWFHIKLPVARFQVRRFCDAEGIANVDNLARPLAEYRSIRALLFEEPAKLRSYFA